jgi:hypothetical protein
MALTSAQLQTLKTAILANPTWSAIPNSADGNFALAALLNATASPTFNVWRTDASVAAILDAVDLSKYTPNDSILDTDTGDALQRKNGRLLTAQTKQMNLQLLLQGRTTINASLVTVRAGLRDAVIALPTGVGGAATAPGGASGVNVLNACIRPATEAEKALATASQGSDTTGTVTARVMGFEGQVSAQDVETARNL